VGPFALESFDVINKIMAASILIIGPAGRLRDGLRTILHTFPGIGEIVAADDFKSGYEQAAKNHPSIVIIDADDSLEDECVFLKQLLSRHDHARCLLIANTMRQAARARRVGADAVLLRGFSTSTLYLTLVDLNVIPESGFAGSQAKLNQQRVTAVQLAQRN
jgi:DNA-binding NarL/FixJ family response regulator